jgi:hypothetical protein
MPTGVVALAGRRSHFLSVGSYFLSALVYMESEEVLKLGISNKGPKIKGQNITYFFFNIAKKKGKKICI